MSRFSFRSCIFMLGQPVVAICMKIIGIPYIPRKYAEYGGVSSYHYVEITGSHCI